MLYKPKEEEGQKGIERKWAEAKAESVRRGQEKKGPQSGPFFKIYISAPVDDETRPLKHPQHS